LPQRCFIKKIFQVLYELSEGSIKTIILIDTSES